MPDRLTSRDWRFLALFLLLAAVSLFVILNWFSAAFPEAALEFKVDRQSSLRVAEPLLRAQQVPTEGLKHTTTFDSDDDARIFLERSIGLKGANEVMKRDVRVWAWHHRWFKPLQEEEWQLDVATSGQIIGYLDKLPEDRALPDVAPAAARAMADDFLRRVLLNVTDFPLVSTSERRLPHRTQRIFTYESRSIRPAGAQYRAVVTVDGNRVTSYSQRLKVPDAFTRAYRQLRSKNSLAGGIDSGFFGITIICALIVFITRLRRGDLHVPTLLAIGAVSVVLVFGTSVNNYPSALAGYDTATSFAAFMAQMVFGFAVQAVGVAMFLIVICGAGEVLYRERLPGQLAIPRLWSRKALTSKRVFFSFVLGYSLVAFFLAYQAAFYLIAGKFGAWSPAEVPYDEMLNSRFPWFAVLFAGFFPALSEEFMSRAFSIPFFERVLRSRVAAIVVAGFIWGFGHATYPNQPFYIRGVEVGLAGVLLGFLFFRFGLLPLLIWHYTVDALYTALLLFRSGNSYYIASGALASLVFAIPMLLSIVLYIRNRGFVADDDLSNATLPVIPPPPPAPEQAAVPLPPPARVSRGLALACVLALAAGALLLSVDPPSPADAIDYRITKERAIAVAMGWLNATQHAAPLAKQAAAPVEGFRSWQRDASNEEGGAPDGFDATAAEYLLHHGMPVREVVNVMRTRIRAGNWMVRTYTPLQKREYLIEVDPRTSQVSGYHRYQDEKAPGARLDQAAALARARAAFATYRLDPNAFEVKEALDFQQPNRRDWLFHFQERQPLVADAWRRVSVRVAGDEVSQFAATIKIPDSVYRKASEQTLLSFALLAARIIAGLLALALIVAGMITATRKGHFPWKRALRWTAVLSVVPLAEAAIHYAQSPFNYNTTMQWPTFVSGTLTSIVMGLGRDLGLIFLSVAGIEVAFPYALALKSREGRARFGRHAALAALTAFAVLAVRRTLLHLLGAAFPAALSVHGISIPEEAAIPLPALLAAGNAIIHALELSAALALFFVALAPFRRRLPWLPAAAGVAIIFFLQLDRGDGAAQMLYAILVAASSALVFYLLARFVLRGNLLAYPAAIALASLLQDAASMAGNHRPDLQGNAIAALVAAIALLVWLAWPRYWTQPLTALDHSG
jgi:membrane protease YdiL (CAAX protease family)